MKQNFKLKMMVSKYFLLIITATFCNVFTLARADDPAPALQVQCNQYYQRVTQDIYNILAPSFQTEINATQQHMNALLRYLRTSRNPQVTAYRNALQALRPHAAVTSEQATNLRQTYFAAGERLLQFLRSGHGPYALQSIRSYHPDATLTDAAALMADAGHPILRAVTFTYGGQTFNIHQTTIIARVENPASARSQISIELGHVESELRIGDIVISQHPECREVYDQEMGASRLFRMVAPDLAPSGSNNPKDASDSAL